MVRRGPLFSLLNSHSRSRRSRSGFTLIEILVVISITAVFSLMSLTYSKAGERQTALYVEAQKLAGLIFRAKSLSLTTYRDANPNRCGYGIEINYAAKTYSLFAYQEPSVPNCPSLTSAPPNFRTMISTYAIDSRLVLKNSASDSLSLVLFVPPNPKTLISFDDGASVSGGPAQVYLETSDSLAQRTIAINSYGQVDF